MTRILFFNINIMKIKILILIININKYLLANTFKFCLKFLKTQNFNLLNLVTSQANKKNILFISLFKILSSIIKINFSLFFIFIKIKSKT